MGGESEQAGGPNGEERPEASATTQGTLATGSSHGAGVGASATASATASTTTDATAGAIVPATDLFAPSEVAGTTAAPAASLPAGSGVDLQQMIDAVKATIQLAARQGVTQARIALQPQELGDIRIHLSQTANGLLARVTADTPAAAQALAGGRSELHQSLSSLGVSLLRLDIGSSAQSEAGERREDFTGGSDGSHASTAPEDGGDPETVEAATGTGRLAAIAGGGLVDVLA
jgi:type III secretion system needle length determinant